MSEARSFDALKEDFLLQRYLAVLQAENIRNRVLRILYNRLERMSDDVLLKSIRLSESGTLDMAPITGVAMPGGNRTISIQEAFGLPGGGSEPSWGDRPASNPFKQMGQLLEAIEHVERHFKERQIKPSTEGG
jgi:hypothetical protein